jgi:hypothetical protein
LSGPVKVSRELAEFEERAGVGDGEFAVCAPSVDEEVDRERGDAVGDDVSDVLHGEVGVGGDGVLDEGVAELAGDVDVVGAVTVAVTEVDELFDAYVSTRGLGIWARATLTLLNNVWLKLWLSPKKASPRVRLASPAYRNK